MIRTFQRIFFFSLLSLMVYSCGARKGTVKVNPSNKVDKGATSSKPTHSRSNLVPYYAELLNVEPKILNSTLYQFIDQWMGIPHQLGGLSRSGIDCSAFVGLVYHEVYNKDLPRTSRDMAEIVKRKYDDELKEGDLLFFSFGGKNIDHVGVYLQNDKFVHVSTKQGVVISNLRDAWYYKYLTRCGTPKS